MACLWILRFIDIKINTFRALIEIIKIQAEWA